MYAIDTLTESVIGFKFNEAICVLLALANRTTEEYKKVYKEKGPSKFSNTYILCKDEESVFNIIKEDSYIINFVNKYDKIALANFSQVFRKYEYRISTVIFYRTVESYISDTEESEYVTVADTEVYNVHGKYISEIPESKIFMFILDYYNLYVDIIYIHSLKKFYTEIVERLPYEEEKVIVKLYEIPKGIMKRNIFDLNQKNTSPEYWLRW